MWMNVAIIGIYHQISGNDVDELYMVIPARYNREALVYPDLDSFISNNISSVIVEVINITFISSKAVII